MVQVAFPTGEAATTSFSAIGEFYDNFSQTSDREVTELLDAARRRKLGEAARAPASRARPAMGEQGGRHLKR